MTIDTCATCGQPFATLTDQDAAELNLRSRVCRCDALQVHRALTAQGFAPLDGGSSQLAIPPVPDDVLREGGWPVTPALGYERGDEDARFLAEEDLPPWAHVTTRAYAWQRLYADAWAVQALQALYDLHGEQVRARAVRVLRRGVDDPAYRAATLTTLRVSNPVTFAKTLLSLLTRP